MRIRSTLAVFATSVAIVASAIAALPEASAAPGATGGPGYLTGTYYPDLIEFVGTQVPGTVPASAAISAQAETLVSEATISSRHIERPDQPLVFERDLDPLQNEPAHATPRRRR